MESKSDVNKWLRMPLSQHDKYLISQIEASPGWKPLKNYIEEKKQFCTDQVMVQKLFDQQSVGKHNSLIGEIQAYQEILDAVKASTEQSRG